MLECIDSQEYKGFKIEIYPDDFQENIRGFYDYSSKMICFHRRYLVGDKHSWDVEDFKEWIEENQNGIIILPIYLYEHSGITISTSNSSYPFNDRWDSGQVGFIYETKKDIRKEFGVKRISKKLHNRIIQRLINEVVELDNVLTGNVYGYEVKDYKDNEIDSCWGFIGDYNSPYIIDEAKRSIDWEIQNRIKNVPAESCIVA